MRKEAPHPGEDEALLYFVQVRDELVFHGSADVHHKEDSDTFSQAFIFAILPKFYAIQPRIQQEAEKGIGQNKLARELGLSNASISYWENEKQEPTASALYKLASYFGVSCDYLLGLQEYK